MNVKSCMLAVWNWLDPIYYSCTRLRRLDSHPHRNILRVRLATYRGPEVMLADGTSVRKGDKLIKIHLHNALLLKTLLPVLSDVRKGKHIFQAVEASLPELADYIKHHRKTKEIKAIFGITMLNKGCHYLGFEAFPIPSTAYRAYKRITQFPLYLMSVSKPFRSFRKHSIKYLIMSKEALLARYCRL